MAPPALTFLAISAVTAEAVGAAAWVRWRFMRCRIDGRSMSPTLADGDWIIADRGSHRDYRPQAGDVVIARDPRDTTHLLAKRIDHIDLHGQVWLLGDNVAESTDSRTFGPVRINAIVARVRWRYFPLSRAARID